LPPCERYGAELRTVKLIPRWGLDFADGVLTCGEVIKNNLAIASGYPNTVNGYAVFVTFGEP